MKAIWSCWTKPFFAQYGSTWLNVRHWLLSWVLSVETARQHYPDTILYTDDEGKRILIDELGLGFETVSTQLNVLNNSDPRWWALGKIYTYRLQMEPFIHIDNDVFLWRRLPLSLELAPLLAQNPEHWIVGQSVYYMLEQFEATLHDAHQGWLPEEWLWHRRYKGKYQSAVNCGILGGNHIDFIHYYADQSIRIVEDPENRIGLQHLTNQTRHMLLLEQYLLSACIDYHRHHPNSPYAEIDIHYLFKSMEDAYRRAEWIGFTHLLGSAKQNHHVLTQLERHVQRKYPVYFERCVLISQRYESRLGSIGEQCL